MKSHATKEILLRGTVGSYGLYQFPSLLHPQSKQYLPANCLVSNSDSQTKSVSTVVSPSSRFMWHVR